MSKRISEINTYGEVIRQYRSIFDKGIINLPNSIPEYKVSENSIEGEKRKLIILISKLYEDIEKNQDVIILLTEKFFHRDLAEFIILYNIEKTNKNKREQANIPNSLNFLINNINDFDNTVYRDKNSNVCSTLSKIYSSIEKTQHRVR